MRKHKLGRSGPVLPSVGLGTLTWGRDTPEDAAADQVTALLDAGGTVIDTSPYFGGGAALHVLGSITSEKVARSDLHIISRAGLTRDGVDASRHSLASTVRETLEALDTTWIDTLVLAEPDPATDMEETADGLATLVRQGLVSQVGLGNCPGWYGARLASLLEQRSVRVAAFHMEYSLQQRGIEREIVPLADEIGAGIIAWSPLGRGVLAGRYRHSIPPDSRAASSHLAGFVEPYLTASARRITESVATAADGIGCDMATVALAWVLSTASCAIVGPRTAAQFNAILAGLDTDVPPALIEALSEASAIEVGYPERF